MNPIKPSVAAIALLALTAACRGNVETTEAPPSASADAAPAHPAESASAAATPPPVGPFVEGELDFQITKANRSSFDVTVRTDGQKTRVDMPDWNGAPAYSIFDNASRQLSVVQDAKKTISTTVFPEPHVAAEKKPASVRPSGQHESVLGRQCEDWQIDEPDGKHETVCVANDVRAPDLATLMPAGSGVPPIGPWMAELREKGQFGLVAIVADPKGNLEGRSHVTKIESHPVDPSIFTLPSDYRTVRLPEPRTK